jgi:hypothetical protein
MGRLRNAYKILIGKPEGNRPFRKLRRMWEDNIRIDPREVWLAGVDWINLTQGRGTGISRRIILERILGK